MSPIRRKKSHNIDNQKEDQTKDLEIIMGLKAQLEEMDKKSEEIQSNISKTDLQIKTVMKQKKDLVEKHNRDLNMLFTKTLKPSRKVTFDYEQTKLKLDEHEKMLRAREAKIESERSKLDNEKRLYDLALMEQRKEDERMWKLAEYQKKEIENLHHQIIELQKKLDEKQRLELEINQLKGKLEVMKHKTDEAIDAKKKMVSIQEQLIEKEEELDLLESFNQTLIVKDRRNNDELHDAQKVLISGFMDNTACAHIVVKRMGDLDVKPFIDAANSGKAEAESMIKLASLWETHLRDPSWHPFKVIVDGDKCKEVLDEKDEMIASLKGEYDGDICNAVATALTELNTYNPIGRYPVNVLWNKKEKKKATLKECVEYLLKQWKLLKQPTETNLKTAVSAGN